MQFWPTLDTFDDHGSSGGPDHYGTSPDRYFAIVPWSTSPELATGYGLRAGASALFDGYQQLVGAGSGAAAFVLDAGESSAAGWCVERQVVSDSVDVSCSNSLRFTGGLFDETSFRQFGLCACVGDGTYTDGGTDEEARVGVDGYFLIEAKGTSTTHRMLLLQLNAGVITVLGSQEVSDVDVSHTPGDELGLYVPRPLRLNVQPDGGGGADLNCYRTAFNGVERQLFGGTVNVGTALDPGRCGFGAQTRFVASSGSQPIGFVESFSVRSGDTSSLLFADEFRRWNRLTSRSIQDGFTSGRSLASAYSGDAESIGGSGLPLSLRRVLRRVTVGAPADKLEVGDPANTDALGFPGWHIVQDPAGSEVQRVRAEFVRLNSETGIAVEMGVALRFSVAPFTPGFADTRGRIFPFGTDDRVERFREGYVVSVTYSSGPTWTLEVRHYDGSQVPTYEADLIATADLSGFVSLGSAFTVDAEIQNYDGVNIGVGPFVAIFIRVGGTTVTPVASSIDGIEVIDDFLIDRRTEATGQSGSNGFTIIPGAPTVGNIVEVRSFERVTPEAEVEIDFRDQVTVAIGAEGDGASGSLVTGAAVVVETRYVDAPTVHRMESGHKNVILRNASQRRLFVCEGIFEDEEWEAVEALYEANGTSVPFDLTNSETAETVRVLFVEDSLSQTGRHFQTDRVVKTMQFEAEEVFSANPLNPEA